MTKNNPKMMSFGCRLNTYESEVMRNHAQKAGLENVIIVNSCAVTAEAERSVRKSIRKARRNEPNAKIIVTGCAAQIHGKEFSEMKEVDQVIGNDLKMQEDTWQNIAKGDETPLILNDIMQVKETASHLVAGFEGRARAFIQVQNGCDHRCTFCIIPYGRGNSRSVPMGEIAKQVRELVTNGYNEIVFTGVDVTSYGADLPGKPKLGEMIRRILNTVPNLPRLRLSSLDPVEIDDDLWKLIETEPRLMPHLHLSLQAGDDMILKRMKRRHLRKDVIDVAQKARKLRPDIVFGADIIAGFPTESEEMFQNTLNIIEEAELTFLHIFPYSPREGTPAARIPQLERSIIKDRAARLREKGNKALTRFLKSQIGTKQEILVEKNNHGHSQHFAPIIFTEESPELNQVLKQGSLIMAHIKGITPDNKLLASKI